MNCPNCRTLNPEAAKFCMNCETSLTEAVYVREGGRLVIENEIAGEKSAFKLDRYLPHELITKLEAARSRSSRVGERRMITMLFCDVKGSTAAAEKVDPEIWSDIMNGAFEYMIRPIFTYEALVPRLRGDAILAFFGAPMTHEDDLQRAVLAGLEILEGIAEEDKVVARVLIAGIHTSDFFGIPATVKPVEFRGMYRVRIKNRTIVEHWGEEDGVSLSTQPGVLKM